MHASSSLRILIAGATGYIGSRLAPALLTRGHEIRAFVRASSQRRVPAGCEIALGDACDPEAYAAAARDCDALIHLVGVAHPAPSKAKEFERVDLASARAAAYAAMRARVKHAVYVSVAHPAPVMRDYIAARLRGEAAFFAAGVPLTLLRPWYVIGPGHYWPLILAPLYRLAEWLPATREHARRLALLNLDDVLRSLIDAVEHPPQQLRILDARAIRGAQAAI